MKLKQTFGLLFMFVFVSSMFLGSVAIADNAGSIESALMAPPNRYVSITSPVNGDTVSGTVTITIDASTTPTLYIDGSRIDKVSTYNWDTTLYSDGQHVIEAKVPGNVDTVTVTVSNGGGTVNNPPTVTITAPADGATISGTYTITVTVEDEDAGLTPDIYIDDVYVTTGTSYDWDTTAYADGSHTIYAEATDSEGLTGSDSNTATVDNSGSGQGWTKDTLTHKTPWWNDVIDTDQTSYTGAGTVVVVIDTGLVPEWRDYFPEDNVLTQYCRSYTDELGYDNLSFEDDDEGHGTAVTGTVIGYKLNDYWITGVAEDAKIVMLRCIYWIGGFGANRVTETDMLNNWADCINYARSLHANELSGYNMVISMSLGYSNSNSNLDAAVAGAENEGIVVSTSAGNDGPNENTTAYPANLADTTSVAAAGHVGLTDAYGLEGIWTDIPEGDFSGVFISDFSSRGKVDITGIGENLILPYAGGYYYISGTSFSCPQVSGVFCLMFEAHGTQSVSWLEGRMQTTAVDLGYSSTAQGAGFVQADGATA
ncbi:MAG: S8 family serine peptidase [Candidatus Lokiarchaeota archaeon]|nr:S8 family serine peptidase [Candidatus Lokiarchaeota archaeon]